MNVDYIENSKNMEFEKFQDLKLSYVFAVKGVKLSLYIYIYIYMYMYMYIYVEDIFYVIG